MSNAPGVVAPASRRAPGPGAGVRIAVALAHLVGQTLLLTVYWPWTHLRATAAFRRALREAGLPPDAVARLTADYSASGSPVQWLRLAMKGWR